MRLLRERPGVDVNRPNYNGLTPLVEAIVKGIRVSSENFLDMGTLTLARKICGNPLRTTIAKLCSGLPP